jgi:hypothetical protein
VAVALAACGASSGEVARECGPRSARTLAHSHLARVYALGRSVYGCAVGGPRSYRLGELSPCLGEGCVSRVRVAGGLAGYASTQRGVDTASADVVVRRLTDGEVLVRDSATRAPLGPESLQSVDALVLKPDGAVAWIGEAQSIVSHSREVEVVRVDRRGEAKLDSGDAIVTGSLRLRASKLTWRDGSATRSATLR